MPFAFPQGSISSNRYTLYNTEAFEKVAMGSHGEAAARALKFDEVTEFSAEEQSNERTLRANDYPQDRGIFKRGAADSLNHLDFFGDCYLEALRDLGNEDTWLHVGPGDFYAEVDYFTSPLFARHARVISNAYCISNSCEAVANLKILEPFRKDEKFSCVNGIKFQDLKGLVPDQIKVIADVFAAGSYDPDLFGFFERAGELLIPGGVLAVVLATQSFSTSDGRSIQPREIYESMKGFELVNSTNNSGWVFRRTNEQFVKPRAELIQFVARNREKGIMWPIRRYKMI